MNAPPLIPQSVWDEERRNICGHGRPWQLTDATALLPGAFFFVDGIRRLAKKQDRAWAVVECVLAGFMFYFHVNRFTGSMEEVCEGICGEPHQPLEDGPRLRYSTVHRSWPVPARRRPRWSNLLIF